MTTATSADPIDRSSVLKACREGDIATLEAAVKCGFDFNEGYDQWTPLHEAVTYRQAGAVAIILANGGRSDPKDTTGATPLHLLAQNGMGWWSTENETAMPEIVALLVKHGALFEEPNLSGRTPLQFAVVQRESAVAEAFLNAGSPPDVRSSPEDRTPLQMAASMGYTEICHCLVKYGADLSISTDRKRAEDWAMTFGHEAIGNELRAMRQSLKAKARLTEIMRSATAPEGP